MSENIESRQSAFSTADITALSHLYRGELYRSTVWRTRLDTTTNWAVLTTGIALSLTFSSESASPLPLVLVGLLVTTFLSIEARRYRFFDFWRMSTAERFQASVAEQKQASGARMRRHAKGPDRAPLHVGGENCSAANGR